MNDDDRATRIASETTVTELLGTTRRLLRAIADPILEAFTALWPEAGGPLRPPAPSALPVLRWLPQACRGGDAETQELRTHLLAASPGLAWSQTYTHADFGPGFLARYGWTELVGQRGPVPSDRLAAGFLLLGPQVVYPAHSHDAEEVYVPLSGRAAWQAGSDAWQTREPGTVIHHPGGMPHAMRTASMPLLALYLWRGGDLTQKSRIV